MQANGQASDLVPMSGFLVVLDHSAILIPFQRMTSLGICFVISFVSFCVCDPRRRFPLMRKNASEEILLENELLRGRWLVEMGRRCAVLGFGQGQKDYLFKGVHPGSWCE